MWAQDRQPKPSSSSTSQVKAISHYDAGPFYPGKRYEDWVLDDPAGKGVDAVRPIRDEIRRRVEALLDELLAARNG